jgi:hypothetical protein
MRSQATPKSPFACPIRGFSDFCLNLISYAKFDARTVVTFKKIAEVADGAQASAKSREQMVQANTGRCTPTLSDSCQPSILRL